MHAEQDRAVRPGAAPDPTRPALDAIASVVPAITVMLASGRWALHAAWAPMLAGDAGIHTEGGPVMDASRLAACVERYLPNVLLLDKDLLAVLDPQSLYRIHALRQQVRVLLLWDEISHGVVVADVLHHRFHGALPTKCPPEVALKAIRAVCRDELWLSRASLTMAITDLSGSSGVDFGATVEAFPVDASETLTPRELQVVELLRHGCINKEIARELGIMEDTVKKHLQSVFAKLGVHRRALVALHRLPGCAAVHSTPHARRMQKRGAIETQV